MKEPLMYNCILCERPNLPSNPVKISRKYNLPLCRVCRRELNTPTPDAEGECCVCGEVKNAHKRIIWNAWLCMTCLSRMFRRDPVTVVAVTEVMNRQSEKNAARIRDLQLKFMMELATSGQQ